MALTMPLLWSCASGGSNGADGAPAPEIYHIDWSKEMDERVIDLSDYADIEYVPLETTDESIFNIGFSFGLSDSLIAISDPLGRRLLFFDRNGRYLHDVNRFGGGPLEYPFMSNAMFDMDLGEIYVIAGQRNIYTYDFNGNMKNKTDSLGRKSFLDYYGLYGDRHLIAWDAGGLQITPTDDNKEKYRYILVDKYTGDVSEIPLSVDHPISGSQTFHLGGNRSQAVTLGLQPIARSRDGYLISDLASDTLYEYVDKKLTPIAVYENIGRSNSALPDRVSVNFASDRYVLLSYTSITDVTKDDITIDEEKTGDYLLDRKTGEIFKYKMRRPYLKEGELDWNLSTLPVSGAPNTSVLMVRAERLLDAQEEGRLNDDAAAVAKQLDIESNPVLIIIRFKE